MDIKELIEFVASGRITSVRIDTDLNMAKITIEKDIYKVQKHLNSQTVSNKEIEMNIDQAIWQLEKGYENHNKRSNLKLYNSEEEL